MENVYDITIIGAGPIGLFTATYALMRQAKVQIIESLSEIGGQVNALFPAKHLYDIPGFDEITGSELISNLENQLNRFKPTINLNETMLSFEKVDDYLFKIQTDKRITYSKTIFLATGVGAFEPRKLKIENAEKYEGHKLFYSVPDPLIFKDKKIVIAGGGDSAADWTLELSKIANQVILVHRRDNFRALESTISDIKAQSNTEILTPFMIDNLDESADKLVITLKRSKTKDEFEKISADALIVNYGFKTDTSLLRKWNLETEQRKITVNSYQETSIKGIYAIGDIAYQPGKVELIATGFGEAPIAINHALTTLYPNKRQATHSTQLMKDFKD